MTHSSFSRLAASVLLVTGTLTALIFAPSPIGPGSNHRSAEAAPLRQVFPANFRQEDPPQPVPAVDEGKKNAESAGEREPEASAPSLETLPFGETLVYRGRVKKAGLTFEAGRATLRVKIDHEGKPALEARAFGEKFGYRMNTRILSTLDGETLRPILHITSDRGTERRTKKIEFREDGADFIRLKHCKESTCEDQAHFVKQAKMHGPIPWGTERVHCSDRDCKHREHYDWRTRTEHRYEEDYVDLLSAIYLARQVEFDPDAEPLIIPIISDTRRWKVRVTAKKRKEITVEAGTFDAVQLVLEPLVADDGKEKDKFRGLFGLNGTIQIWVERSSRRPVLIEGTLPFAFLELHAEIELESIEVSDEIAAKAKEQFPDRSSGGAVSATGPAKASAKSPAKSE